MAGFVLRICIEVVCLPARARDDVARRESACGLSLLQLCMKLARRCGGFGFVVGSSSAGEAGGQVLRLRCARVARGRDRPVAVDGEFAYDATLAWLLMFFFFWCRSCGQAMAIATLGLTCKQLVLHVERQVSRKFSGSQPRDEVVMLARKRVPTRSSRPWIDLLSRKRMGRREESG